MAGTAHGCVQFPEAASSNTWLTAARSPARAAAASAEVEVVQFHEYEVGMPALANWARHWFDPMHG